jgi:hypothetical protein
LPLPAYLPKPLPPSQLRHFSHSNILSSPYSAHLPTSKSPFKDFPSALYHCRTSSIFTL